MSMFATLRRALRRRKYVVGARWARFLAPDIQREVEIVDASEVDEGFVRVRMRTWNVLYAAGSSDAVPELGAVRRVAITELWTWTGAPWGGPVADDGSAPSPDDADGPTRPS